MKRLAVQNLFVARTQFGGTVSLGTVNGPGYETTIDLSQMLGPAFFQTVPPPVSLGVWVTATSSPFGATQGRFIGQIDLRPLTDAAIARQVEADELAWKNAEPDACARVRTDAACAGVMRYVAALPNGRHAVEAQQPERQKRRGQARRRRLPGPKVRGPWPTGGGGRARRR